MYTFVAVCCIFTIAQGAYVIPAVGTSVIQGPENTILYSNGNDIVAFGPGGNLISGDNSAYSSVLFETPPQIRHPFIRYQETPVAIEKSSAAYNAHVVNSKVAAKYVGQVVKQGRDVDPIDSYGRPVRAENLDYVHNYLESTAERVYDDGSYREDGNEKLYDDGSYKHQVSYW